MDEPREMALDERAPAADPRIVYGAGCSWWESISKIATKSVKIAGDDEAMELPCCPHCKGVLFEVASEEVWWANVAAHIERSGETFYREFIEWVRGKCFPSTRQGSGADAARAAFEAERLKAKVQSELEKVDAKRPPVQSPRKGSSPPEREPAPAGDQPDRVELRAVAETAWANLVDSAPAWQKLGADSPAPPPSELALLADNAILQATVDSLKAELAAERSGKMPRTAEAAASVIVHAIESISPALRERAIAIAGLAGHRSIYRDAEWNAWANRMRTAARSSLAIAEQLHRICVARGEESEAKIAAEICRTHLADALRYLAPGSRHRPISKTLRETFEVAHDGAGYVVKLFWEPSETRVNGTPIWVDFEIVEIFGVVPEPPGQKRLYSGENDPVSELGDAWPFINGFVKFDGCTQWWADCAHVDEAVDLDVLLGAIRLARHRALLAINEGAEQIYDSGELPK